MARLSQGAAALMNSLIRQGVVPEEAEALAINAIKKIPAFSQGRNRGDFMAALEVMNQNAPFSSATAAKKAMRDEDYEQPARSKRDMKEKEINIGSKENSYVVYTTLPKQFVKDILMQTLQEWISFAQGQVNLGGRGLKHPSGRYAASLAVNQKSANFFTVFSDSPYADVLETGHGQVNLKTYLENFSNNHDGSYVDIPLGKNSAIKSSAKGTARVAGNSSRFSARSNVSPEAAQNAYMKRYTGSGKDSGVRRMSVNSKGWIIPPMRAYHPAYHLWQKLNRQIKLMEKVLT